jgi:hypothetical protein
MRFTSVHSAHEVYIDDEQLRWFESTLEAAAGRPVIVFTHAPPLGCGLKVLQEVHVKNRSPPPLCCACLLSRVLRI